jgi:PBP1b-binding outer membrane lipoprotein LpoB
MTRLQKSFAAAGFAALMMAGCASSNDVNVVESTTTDEVIVVTEQPTPQTTMTIVETTVPIENPSMISSSQADDEPAAPRERLRKD